jgi:hypothetical protein
MDVSLQLEIEVAGVPLKVTVLAPCVEPKFVPAIVTVAPTAPVLVERPLIVGVGRTVNGDPALTTPLTVTTTLPDPVAPDGTVATMDVLLQLVIEAVVVVPGKVTVLVPCDEPKFIPVIVTVAPTAPVLVERPLIVGVRRTVNCDPALETLLTVTTTLPVVAPAGTVTTMDALLQLVIEVTVVPLKVTVLTPCDEP